MFTCKLVGVMLFLPVPIIEVIFFTRRHKATLYIGIGSKIGCIVVMMLFLIEGSMIRWTSNYKTDLQNSIRNIGWSSCFADPQLNLNFIRVPSLFSSTLDDFVYISYVFLWATCIGFVILAILAIKVAMDIYVRKKTRYGEYDVAYHSSRVQLEDDDEASFKEM